MYASDGGDGTGAESGEEGEFKGSAYTEDGLPDNVVAKSVSVDGGYEDKHLQQIQTEIHALQRLRHQHIIGYVGVFVQPTMVTILTEYAPGGTVRAQIDRARAVGRLDARRVERWMKQLAAGLEFIHRHMLHRDLKPCNLLLDGADTLKICDFGWSTAATALARTFAGSPLYMAPEVLRREPYGLTADLWSVGVILYELLTLTRPFQARDISELADVVETHRVDLACDELLRACGHRTGLCWLATSDALLHADGSKRTTSAELMQALLRPPGPTDQPGDGSPDDESLESASTAASILSTPTGSPGSLVESRTPPVPRQWLAPGGAPPRQRRPPRQG